MLDCTNAQTVKKCLTNEEKYGIIIKLSRRDAKNLEKNSLFLSKWETNHIEKEFEKSWKKYLTNSKRCDIINKLSRKRGLTQKKAFEWNGILKIEQWTTKRNPWKFRAELE